MGNSCEKGVVLSKPKPKIPYYTCKYSDLNSFGWPTRQSIIEKYFPFLTEQLEMSDARLRSP